MQARNDELLAAPVEVAVGVVAGADEDVAGAELGELEELTLDVLLPQAATSRLAAAAAAVVINAVCLTVSSTGPGFAGCAQASRGSPHGPDCPQTNSR